MEREWSLDISVELTWRPKSVPCLTATSLWPISASFYLIVTFFIIRIEAFVFCAGAAREAGWRRFGEIRSYRHPGRGPWLFATRWRDRPLQCATIRTSDVSVGWSKTARSKVSNGLLRNNPERG